MNTAITIWILLMVWSEPVPFQEGYDSLRTHSSWQIYDSEEKCEAAKEAFVTARAEMFTGKEEIDGLLKHTAGCGSAELKPWLFPEESKRLVPQ